MSSRVGSAVLALTAAALLAVSLATAAWWSGPPTIGNHTYDRRTFHIGLIQPVQSEWCNTDGDSDSGCQHLALGSTFVTVKYVELGLVASLALMLVGLGITGLRDRDARRVFGRLALVAAGLSAIVAVVLFVLTPEMREERGTIEFAAPFGYGIYLFFGGAALSIVAGVMSMLQATAPRQPGWESRAMPQQPPPPQQPVDVLALLGDDALRPAALGPEPRMGARSPGGMLAGPSGPLVPMPAPSGPQSQPLFSSAPQLRPLYEASADQGGSDGFVRPSAPHLPTRGPTPLPVAAVSAITGAATPPPAKALPPPMRGKPPSIAPPPSPPPTRPNSPSTTAPTTTLGPAIGAAALGRPAPITRPPPFSTGPINRAQPTLAAAAVPPPRDVPMPASFALGAPKVTTPSPTLAGMVNMTLPRPETDADDRIETVDFEKQTLEHGRPDESGRSGVYDTGPSAMPVDTDPSVFATGDSTSPSVPFETMTGDSQTFSTEIPTANDPDPDDLETAAQGRISAPMAAVAPRVSEPILTSAPRTQTPSKPIAPPPKPATEQVKAVATPTGPVKIPISTASSSLPPPKEKPSAVAGPSPACPQCESPMAWVEEHLRFYCKSCRMYF